MKVGFSKIEITPPVGTELGGYAGYRPCAGVHDPLWCKAVVLEQDEKKYALLAMDLLSVDESLAEAISGELKSMGVGHTLVAAIHSHATPCGIVPGVGPLAEVNRVGQADPTGFAAYNQGLVRKAVGACRDAVEHLEAFTVRTAKGSAPIIGSERHTGETVDLTMTVVQILTDSGRTLLLYQIPCHPTVLGPENLLASADFVGGIEGRLDVDMAVFLNGAAGDISTRFTRRGQTFEECDRMAAVAAEAIKGLIRDVPYGVPERLRGVHTHITLKPRPVETEESAKQALVEAEQCWRDGMAAGKDPAEVRVLKSYVEGAGVALEFSRTMAGIRQLVLPVTAFSVAGLDFVTVPGEMFSSLGKSDAVPICYTNGYYRYIADENAYDQGYYEAMAAIMDRGQGEVFMKEVNQLRKQLS